MSKKAINIIIDRVVKEEYRTFETEEQLQAAYLTHLKTINQSHLSPSWKKKLKEFLKHLKFHSRTYFGLSFISQRRSAELLELKKADTVGEWLKKLVQLNIVNVIHTKRSKNMQQSVNFVQILPPQKKGQVTEETGEKKGEHNSSSFYSFKTSSNSLINVTKNAKDKKPAVQLISKQAEQEDDNQLDTKYISEKIPREFANALQPYSRDARTIELLYKKVCLAFRQSNRTKDIAEYTEELVRIARALVRAVKFNIIKQGNSLHSVLGYLYGTSKKMFSSEPIVLDRRKSLFSYSDNIC